MTAAHPLRAELRALTRLAVPLAIAQGGQALMGVVDTAVTGRAGAVPLAGVGLGNAAFFGIAIFAMGIMQGLDPLMAQAVGARDEARARHLLWQGAWLAAVLSAAFAIPIALLPALLAPAGIEPEVAAAATRYILWRLPSLPFVLLYSVGRSYLQAFGTMRPIVVAVIGANLANLGLDVLLVFGGAGLPAWTGPLRLLPAMGASGAAIATTICAVLQAAVLLRAAIALGDHRPHPGAARIDRGALRAAGAVGLPIGLHMGAEVGIFALASFVAGRLGATALAAHQIGLAIASLTFTIAVGFGNAGSVRVGLAVGARSREDTRRAGLAAFGAGAAFMSCSALAFLLFPRLLARLLTDDPAVLDAAAPLLRIAALFQLSDGLQGVGAGVLRGVGETRFTFLANMAGHWAIGLPAMALFVFALDLGLVGLWAAFCLGLTAVAASLVTRFLQVSARDVVPLAERGAPGPAGP